MCRSPRTVQTDQGFVPQFTQGDRMRVALRHAGVSVQEMAGWVCSECGVEIPPLRAGRWTRYDRETCSPRCRQRRSRRIRRESQKQPG